MAEPLRKEDGADQAEINQHALWYERGLAVLVGEIIEPVTGELLDKALEYVAVQILPEHPTVQLNGTARKLARKWAEDEARKQLEDLPQDYIETVGRLAQLRDI